MPAICIDIAIGNSYGISHRNYFYRISYKISIRDIQFVPGVQDLIKKSLRVQVELNHLVIPLR